MLRTLMTAVTATSLLAGLTPAMSDVCHWDGNGSLPPDGTFGSSWNWNPDIVPAAGDHAFLDHTFHNYTIFFSHSPTNASLRTSNGAHVHLRADGSRPTYHLIGPVTVGDGFLHVHDLDLLAIGGIDVRGGQLSLESGDLGPCYAVATTVQIGDYNVGGDLDIVESHELAVASSVTVGEGMGHNASLFVGVSGSLLCGSLQVGGNPGNQSSLLINSAGSITSGDGVIGRGGSQALVTGPNSTWTLTDTLNVGSGGWGELTISEGGNVSCTDAYLGSDVWAENDLPEGGTVIVEDISVSGSLPSWDVSGSLYIGRPSSAAAGGFGVVTINDGELTVDNLLRIQGSSAPPHPVVDSELNINGGEVRADQIQLAGNGLLNLADGEVTANTLDVGASSTDFAFTGGVLHVGTLYEILHNDGGTLAPGNSIGTTDITWQYYQNAGATQIEIAGSDFGDFDYVTVGGQATLAGDLELVLRERFVPDVSDELVPFYAAGGINSAFENAIGYVDVANGGGFNVEYPGFSTVALSNYRTAFAYRLLRNQTTTTGDWRFLGPPDDAVYNIAEKLVEYDFGAMAIMDEAGPDFNVYEADWGAPEFDRIDVLVSMNGSDWISVKASEGSMVRIPGDEAHGNNAYARSYDLAGAGLAMARYVRIDGINGGGFDLDAIGVIREAMWPYPDKLSANATGQPDQIFTGFPDNVFAGIGGQVVEYDFGDLPIIDRGGSDFNVYEVAVGGPEFGSIAVLVSNDGYTWTNVKGTEGPVVRIPGDEVHDNDAFARSYDLAGSGLAEARYLRIDGVGGEPGGGSTGFDLDAVGAIHVPLAWQRCGTECGLEGADADFNDDCVVDLSDLATILSNFGLTGAAAEDGDTDGDGAVNLTDLAQALAVFGASCP